MKKVGTVHGRGVEELHELTLAQATVGEAYQHAQQLEEGGVAGLVVQQDGFENVARRKLPQIGLEGSKVRARAQLIEHQAQAERGPVLRLLLRDGCDLLSSQMLLTCQIMKPNRRESEIERERERERERETRLQRNKPCRMIADTA